MIMRGLVEEGLDVVRAARDRHDGSRRNPWNDIECGSYYARSMSAWQLVNAWAGLSADLVAGRIGFAPKPQGDFAAVLVGRQWHWPADPACRETDLSVLGGSLDVSEIAVAGLGVHRLRTPRDRHG